MVSVHTTWAIYTVAAQDVSHQVTASIVEFNLASTVALKLDKNGKEL